ncbi:MAG: hypothetical protein VZS44_05145 [Bacilli bacterium]|nr:hypothetical protein [Bacilli bacterium]
MQSKSVNQSLKYNKKRNNNTVEKLEEINETSKFINYILIRVIIAGIILTTPMFLYVIALLPKAIPLSLLMVPALIGGPLAAIASATMLATNILFFIPAKKLMEAHNKKTGNIKVAKQNNYQTGKQNTINNNKAQTIPRKPQQNYGSINNNYNKNNSNNNKVIKREKPTHINKQKSVKVKPQQKIVFKNGRPCYENETPAPKIRRLKK